ncbi:hypothetical protein [Salipiger sp. PrR003]|uniref:hypothetical protein n=1 Tax=Salipiger sp. PrR003 TaxID=2706776 RepID=UPI0013DC2A43|nr:hypothetical protein [Salipiger sp. PrR003]NDV51511.1 hypothetical protein [Salipiger sp. PrR003]
MERVELRALMAESQGDNDMWARRSVMLLDCLEGTDIDYASPTLLDDMTAAASSKAAIKAFLETLPGWPGSFLKAARDHISYLQCAINTAKHYHLRDLHRPAFLSAEVRAYLLGAADANGEIGYKRAVELIDCLQGSNVDFEGSTMFEDMIAAASQNPAIKNFLESLPGWDERERSDASAADDVSRVSLPDVVGYSTMLIAKTRDHLADQHSS